MKEKICHWCNLPIKDSHSFKTVLGADMSEDVLWHSPHCYEAEHRDPDSEYYDDSDRYYTIEDRRNDSLLADYDDYDESEEE